MRLAYASYIQYIEVETYQHRQLTGTDPTGMDRKRIYEAAAMRLPGAASTSMIWTTNPTALKKLIRERTDDASDLEFQRFARLLAARAKALAPNLFVEADSQ